MKSRDWFMLAARIFGLFVLYVSFTYLASYVDYCLGYRHDTDSGKGYLVHGCVHLGLALYLLLGTRHLARQVYSEENRVPAGEETTPPSEAVHKNDS